LATSEIGICAPEGLDQTLRGSRVWCDHAHLLVVALVTDVDRIPPPSLDVSATFMPPNTGFHRLLYVGNC